jgi:hypothetical protein
MVTGDDAISQHPVFVVNVSKRADRHPAANNHTRRAQVSPEGKKFLAWQAELKEESIFIQM